MAKKRFTLALVATALAAQAPAPPANLNQLMRGIFFPQSNVIFAAQNRNPAEIKTANQPSASTDPLTGVFGGWEAIENVSLALSEDANLLTLPGRKCSNGRDVPVANADWAKFVNEVREAGLAAYKAAQSRNQDNMVTAADQLNTSCSDCHQKYRPRNMANRCQ